MKRFIVLASVLSVALFMFGSAAFGADSGVIKLAHSEKNENQYKAMTTTFKDTVEKETKGRFKVQVFPNGQLGNLRSMLEQCQRGLIQSTTAQSLGLLSAYYPKLQILETPFAFKNPQQILTFFDTKFMQDIVEEMAATKGIRLLAIMPAGMRCFSNNVRPIVKPDDMKGLKIRVMEIPIYLKMVQALGASPTPVSWEELYTALQTGVVDGQENAPNSMILAGLQDVQKYYTLDNHVGNIVTFSMNEKFFKGLSAADQKVVRAAAKKAAKAFVDIVSAKEEQDIKFLSTKMQITRLSNDQMKEFEKKTMPSILSYLKSEIGEDTVNQFQEELKKLK